MKKKVAPKSVADLNVVQSKIAKGIASTLASDVDKAKTNAFTRGRLLIIQFQRNTRAKDRPRLPEAKKLAKKFVKEAGLLGDSGEYYFTLLAVSALTGQEKMYQYWKR